MSHAIEPTADGARGKELLVQYVIGDNGDFQADAAVTERWGSLPMSAGTHPP